MKLFLFSLVLGLIVGFVIGTVCISKKNKAVIINGVYLRIPEVGSSFSIVGESNVRIHVEVVDEQASTFVFTKPNCGISLE